MRLPLVRILLVFVFLFATASVNAFAQPPGFQLTTVWSGFSTPVAVRFAPDGRAFVLEKWGRIFAFDSTSDTTPTTVADFGNQIYSFHDHGILGLAVDPQFPTRPYLYILYALRGAPGGRLSRITINPATNMMSGPETVLIENWAQVYPSHSIGNLAFGPEGALYVSAGEGADYGAADWGQSEPLNPDNDARGPIDINDPPLEGGSLRSQDIRSTADPLGFSGTILRVNPDTGAAWPGNPLQGGSTSDDRIIAYGLRNPFRFTVHPTNNSVWICDAGWNDWEELNRIPYPFPNPVPNFGWPAYEGPNPQPQFQSANLPLLQSLYSAGTATAPFYSYPHSGGACISGATFYRSGNYPSQYQGALFIADYSIGWIKVMLPDASGTPNPASIQTFMSTGANAVDLQIGPGGDIFFVDLIGTRVRRIAYLTGNNPPNAVIQATPTSGNAPLLVSFNGSSSSDPDPGDSVTYSWDLNGDGIYGDSTAATTQYTYAQSGNFTALLRVTDKSGATDTKGVTISVNNRPPVPEILTPTNGTQWKAGDTISFSGRSTDPESGQLAASQLSWQVVLLHCHDDEFVDCHEHPVLQTSGVASGQFLAVDHEYPCYMQIRLTATEPGTNGLSVTTTRDLFPQITTLTMQTNPPGLYVGVFSESAVSPLVRDVVVNGQSTISTFSPQSIGQQAYDFSNWSDGGTQSHTVRFTASPMTITANFVPSSGGTNTPPVLGPLWEQSVTAGSGIGLYISATDPDGPIPTLSATNLPAGAQFIQQADRRAYLEWFTKAGDAGDHTITITATDNGVPPMSTSGNLILHVLSGNKPPSMDGVWNTQVNAGQYINIRIGAWDTDGDVPDLFAQNLPPGASYNEDGFGTGFLTWQTSTASAGVYTGIRVYAVDHGTPPMTSDRVFKITVLGSANTPVIDPIPSSTVVAGNTLTLNVTAFDPNGTTPVLTAQNLPAGASFASTGGGNGVFNWPTRAADAGNHSGLTILATDSVTPSLTYKAMFNVKVISAGNAPVLDPIGAKSGTVGTQLQFTVTATDPDSGPPALSAANLPSGATFTNNANGTGTFTWSPGTGAQQGSPYSVTFVASDGTATDSEVVAITIASGNRAPVVATVGNKTVAEAQLLQFTVSATDPDGTVPTLTAQSLPAGANFTNNGNGTGTFSWTPGYTAAATSPYSVTFRATDGSLTDTEPCTITVTNTNRAPVVAPVSNKTVAEGQQLQFNVTATDPDGTVPTLSAQSLPSGATFVSSGNGIRTFTWTPGYTAAGASPYTVRFTASDGSLSHSVSTTVSVSNTNRPPVITTVGSKNVSEGQLLRFNVSASDPDGTAPVITAQPLPPGATLTNNGGGTATFSWTPNYDAAASSPYTVFFTASDGTLSNSKPCTIFVKNRNPSR